MKARGAKRIRLSPFSLERESPQGERENYKGAHKNPRSPGCKRCPLDIGSLMGASRVVGKPLNGPPGKYVRKDELFG